MPEPGSKPRAFWIAGVVATLVAVLVLVADLVGWLLERSGVSSGGVLEQLLLGDVAPFRVSIFRPDRTADQVLPFLVGFLVLVVLAWFIVLLVSRKGGLAAFVGTWFGVMVAAWAANLLAGLLHLAMNDVSLRSVDSAGVLAGAFDHGLHWGFEIGWFPGILAAVLVAVLRKPATTRMPASTAGAGPGTSGSASLQGPRASGQHGGHDAGHDAGTGGGTGGGTSGGSQWSSNPSPSAPPDSENAPQRW